MLTIPLQPVPSQKFTVLLGGQACQLSIYQKQFGLFIDVSVNNTLIIAGVLCENLNRIVRSLYLGFAGDLAFVDTQASGAPEDPNYRGLGDRFKLLYLTAAELPAGQG